MLTERTPSPAPHRSEPSPKALAYVRAAGHVSLIATLLVFFIVAYRKPEPYNRVYQLVVAHIMGGRAGNAGIGLQLGFSPWFLLFQSCMQDYVIMLYLYPLFISGYRRASRWPLIGRGLSGVREVALKHKGRIEPYGAVGLMIFVLFPFWSTGALVGVVVGYLIGLRMWVTFASVIAGNTVAVAAWIWFYSWLKDYNQRLALSLLVAFFVFAMGGTLYARIRRSRKWGAKPKQDSTLPPTAVAALQPGKGETVPGPPPQDHAPSSPPGPPAKADKQEPAQTRARPGKFREWRRVSRHPGSRHKPVFPIPHLPRRTGQPRGKRRIFQTPPIAPHLPRLLRRPKRPPGSPRWRRRR